MQEVILIVHSAKRIRDKLTVCFSQAGYYVCVAANVADGLKIMRRDQPNAIFLGQNLPRAADMLDELGNLCPSVCTFVVGSGEPTLKQRNTDKLYYVRQQPLDTEYILRLLNECLFEDDRKTKSA